MSVEITLRLPETLIEHVEQFGLMTERNVEEILLDTLEMMWPTVNELPDTTLYPPISTLSDIEIVGLADAKMNPIQNRRLGQLQVKGKSVGLTHDERYELFALIQIYQLGQLRKSQGLAEVVRRGLRPPLPV